MKWIEIIKIRSIGISEKEKALKLLERFEEEHNYQNLLRIKKYKHSSLDNDLSIHLHWNSENIGESVLGYYLTEAFKAFGLVNHSVWIEESRQK